MTATNTENYFVPRRLPLGSRKLKHCFQGYAGLHTLSPHQYAANRNSLPENIINGADRIYLMTRHFLMKFVKTRYITIGYKVAQCVLHCEIKTIIVKL